MSDLIGTTLGQYQILREIGRGGMAVVYEAYQPSLGRSVAIKVLPPQYTFDATFVQRFQQEARAAARLDHPNIVSIYDVGEQNGVYYIVMQKLEGASLHDMIQRSGRIPPERAAHIAAQVAQALNFAHTHGLTHRDIKPSNILISSSDHATLTDFGIAKAAEGTRMTQTGLLMGTPEYMSPEQATGKPVGPASDIYSLGIVLYQMLTGRAPFKADSTPALLFKQVYERPAPVRTYVPHLSTGLEQVLDRALAKEPAERFRSAEEMATALLQATGNQPLPASGSLRTVFAPIEPLPARQTPRPPSRPASRNLPRPMLAAVALGLFALVFLAIGLKVMRPGPAGPQTTVAEQAATEAPEATTTPVPPPSPTAPPPAVDRTASLTVQLAQVQDRIAAGAWNEALVLSESIRVADASFQPDRVRDARFVACLNLGKLTEDAGSVVEAQHYWSCALEEHPIDDEARVGKRHADLYLEAQDALMSGDPGQAVVVWQTLYDEKSTYADVASRLYEAYITYGDAWCRGPDGESREAARVQYTMAQALAFERPEAGNALRRCALPETHLAVVEVDEALRVRTGPGMGYLILGRLVSSTPVTITGRTLDASWAMIEADPERIGWASSEYLKSDVSILAAAIAPTPAPARSVLVAQAGHDFSGRQGHRNWFYLRSQSPDTLQFVELPWDASSGRWYRDPSIHQQMRLSDRGSYPSARHDVARMWASPYDGMLHIFGSAAKESGAGRGGNGVRVSIVQNDQVLWAQDLDGYDTTGVTFNLTVDGKGGDRFYFITGALGDDFADNTIFEPSIKLLNPDGIDLPEPTPWPEDTPTPLPPTVASPPALCFQPRLRHYEPHKGCCAEVAGVAFNRQGAQFAPRGAVVRIEGPSGPNQYSREFALAADGGYNVTALSVNPYTIWLKGPGIRSDKFAVTFPDPANIREIVDFWQVACR